MSLSYQVELPLEHEPVVDVKDARVWTDPASQYGLPPAGAKVDVNGGKDTAAIVSSSD